MSNNEEISIKVENVRKYFKVYPDKGKTLKDKILFYKRNKFEKHEVLKGISFDVKKGEAIGLIGKNGCGKSTTLKLLTRILRPNEGTITINGRVSSLIELGAGFHPDLTGRENIYINASIFGIKAKEVDERLDDIIRFSELEEYIDNPVRTYSSGMYMRLAFSVAINVDADVLLIDEILAVGDSAFQEKCFNKLKSLKEEGKTIVIVSHSMGQIEMICDRCIWIEKGIIKEEGETLKVCKDYNESMNESRIERARKESGMAINEIDEDKRRQIEKNASCWNITKFCSADAKRTGNEIAKFTKVNMVNENNEITNRFHTGENIRIDMDYISSNGEIPINIAIKITRKDWQFCYGTSSKLRSEEYLYCNGEGKISFVLPKFPLLDGTYYLDVRLEDDKGTELDICAALIQFSMTTEEKVESGIFSAECKVLK